jgi:hypothetical protein
MDWMTTVLLPMRPFLIMTDGDLDAFILNNSFIPANSLSIPICGCEKPELGRA